MKVGQEIYLFYDARPWVPHVKAFKCVITKLTKTGFKIKNLDSPGEYENVLYYPDGTARGWQTLRWRHPDATARLDYTYCCEYWARGACPFFER